MIVAGRTERIRTRTVLWAAGVAASPLARRLATATGATIDRAGRVHVQPDLSLPGHPEIAVIGDMVHFEQDGALLAGVAPVAMAEGRYAARRVLSRIAAPRASAVPLPRQGQDGDHRPLGLSPTSRLRALLRPPRLAHLAVHLWYLVEFENRLLVLVQWAYSFVTRNAVRG